jgi:cation diffusion facilitator CzcD-associated flavoprotein CzcO
VRAGAGRTREGCWFVEVDHAKGLRMRFIIVGAGFGGVAAAIELRKHGFDDVTLLEAAPDFGGTWYHNRYPGVACDVPSHFYSFSYAQRRDWSRLCSSQEEILDYLRGVVRDHDLERHIVTGARVSTCEWSDATHSWTVRTDDGTTREADAVVIATGQLHQPAWPNVEDRESFAGHSFHSAQWDTDYDLRGKRVAVIGTGASAVQFIPEVAEQAERLVVFQRTGNWFLPRRNRPYPRWLKAIFRQLPGVQRMRRSFLFYYMETLTATIRNPRTVGLIGRLYSTVFMRSQLKDPEVRRKVWPDYTFGCKRVLFSSLFLPALQRSNVEVVTEPIARMGKDGPVTEDGRTHEVDCVIYGTGFRTNDFMFPMEVVGTQGRSLRDVWADGAHAHLGITVPGFPSMFILYGPNTNTSGGSIIYYLEAQAAYVRQAAELVRDRGAAAIDVLPEIESANDRGTQQQFAGTAWLQCSSWYRNPDGRVIANWPGYMSGYARRTRTLDPGEYRLLHTAHDPTAVSVE